MVVFPAALAGAPSPVSSPVLGVLGQNSLFPRLDLQPFYRCIRSYGLGWDNTLSEILRVKLRSLSGSRKTASGMNEGLIPQTELIPGDNVNFHPFIITKHKWSKFNQILLRSVFLGENRSIFGLNELTSQKELFLVMIWISILQLLLQDTHDQNSR